jgi:hypothetical protein
MAVTSLTSLEIRCWATHVREGVQQGRAPCVCFPLDVLAPGYVGDANCWRVNVTRLVTLVTHLNTGGKTWGTALGM